MEDLNLYRIYSFCVFVDITEDWRYIVEVSEEKFKNVIEEVQACAFHRNKHFNTDIDLNDNSEGIIFKNFKIDDRIVAFIEYVSIEDDDL